MPPRTVFDACRRLARRFEHWRLRAAIEWTVVAATAVVLGAAGLTRPLYNWDMIGYVAAAHTADGLSGRVLSEQTYRDVETEVGPAVFATLVSGEYRETVWRDPEALRQQLPIVRIRVAYVSAMRLLHRAGLSYPQATYVISAVAAATAALVLALLCRTLGVSLLVVPLVVWSCGYVRLARLSTPDAIATVGALTTMWLWLRGRSAAYVVAALLPLVRSDFVLVAGLMAGADWLRGRRRLAAAVGAVIAGALYVAVNHAAGGYGWRVLVHLTFIVGAFPYPERLPLATDPGPFLQMYRRGVWSVVSHPHVLIYLAALATFLRSRIRRPMAPDHAAALGVMTAFVAVHWAFFPVYGERFFSAPASVVLLVLAGHGWRVVGWPPQPESSTTATT